MKIINLILWVIILTAFSCEENSSKQDKSLIIDSETHLKNASSPTEKEIIEKAKSFVRAYLEDSKTFFKEVDNLMGSDIKAEFDKNNKRWYVFFTNGFNHIHVYLDEYANLGTVVASSGKVITRLPESNISESPKSLPPLFHLSEFKKVANLPHNK